MVNKRGLIKIVEAVIAILIISGVFLAVSISQQPIREKNLGETISELLVEVAKNPEFRRDILTRDLTDEEGYLTSGPIYDISRARLPSKYTLEIKICQPDEICSLKEYHETIFTQERIISSTLDIYAPKKIKIFLWQ
jgi:hypothetical protein